MGWRSQPGTVLLVLLLACTLFVTPIGAGDNASIFYVDPAETEADPGETVTLDLVVSSHGSYSGDGLVELGFELDYDPDVVTVASVDGQAWLADEDGDAETTIDVDEDTGTISLNESREPPGDGATGTEAAATITLEIAADAPSSTTTVSITDATATLVNGYPQGTVERDADIVIDGGESGDPSADSTESTRDDPEGVTLADDADGTDDADNADDGTETSPRVDTESTAAFGLTATVIAITIVMVLRRL